jgi:hypothetical protein
MSLKNRDNEDRDRKSIRREIFNKKKSTVKQNNSSDEFKIKNKIKHELKSKKMTMQEEELWEDWENQLDRYR